MKELNLIMIGISISTLVFIYFEFFSQSDSRKKNDEKLKKEIEKIMKENEFKRSIYAMLLDKCHIHRVELQKENAELKETLRRMSDYSEGGE